MKKRVIAICILLIIFCITFIVATPKLEKENDTSTLSVAEGSAIYAITVDGVKSTSFPSKGLYRVGVNCEGARGKWDYENWKLYVDDITGNVSCDISFTTISKTYLNNKIIGLSGTTQGTGQVVNENGYRYEGKNPNNYIWFNNELWRIVGVFGSASHGQSGNLVKIVRESSLGYNYINEAYVTNNWLKASLKRLLNVYYYRGLNGTNSGFCGLMGGGTKTCDYSGGVGLNAKSRSMIQSVRWYLGSVSNTSTDANYYQATTANWYSYERGSTVYSGNPTYDTGYIGLLYPSDYGYSVLASSCSRTQKLSSYNTASCVGQSWLSDQNGTWFITPASDDKNNTSIVWFSGSVSLTNNGYGYGVRPTLYLDSSVYVLDGDGSITNPYIIERDGSVTLPPEVASVSTSVSSSSITFTTTAYQGTNAIQYYYYSVNGGSSWYASASSATSNTFTINGLASNTNYDLRIKVLDTNGNQSNVVWPASATTLYASPSVTNVTFSSVSRTGFTVNAYASPGTNSLRYYYISIDGGSSWYSYTSSSTSLSASFSANSGTYYSVVVKVYDTAGYVSNSYYAGVTTLAGTLFANYITGLYSYQGSNDIYYHNGTLAYDASDYSFRYAGSNPSNYVCFGTYAYPCPDDNLYRIIGVFGSSVKLLKYRALGDTYYWGNLEDEWANSYLNWGVLNGSFLNNFTSTWLDMMASSVWWVGGLWDTDLTLTMNQVYNYEAGNGRYNNSYIARVALMYVTDYTYAQPSTWWDWTPNELDNTSPNSYNWIWRDGPLSFYGEWLLPKNARYSDMAATLSTRGGVWWTTKTDSLKEVRPAFYLNSNVYYSSGNGAYSNPYYVQL